MKKLMIFLMIAIPLVIIILINFTVDVVIGNVSIAVDRISLTIADVRNNIFDVAVIPHTYENTVLSSLKCNDCVNIEFDIIVKYLEKRLSMYHNSSKVTLELLEENGFV